MINLILLISIFSLFFWIIFDKLKRDSDEINRIHNEMHKDKDDNT